MEKTICAVIAMILLLSCCLCHAESEVPVPDQPQAQQSPLAGQAAFTARPPMKSSVSFAQKAQKYAVQPMDTVAVKGSMNIVRTNDNIILIMDVPAGYACLTQDIEASVLAYITFESPDAVQQYMINNNVHLLLVDNFTSGMVSIATADGDALANLIGNLSAKSPDQVNEYAKALAISMNAVLTDVISVGSYTWVRFYDTYLLTVVGGHYVFARWEDETMTEDDLEGVKELLANLTCFV